MFHSSVAEKPVLVPVERPVEKIVEVDREIPITKYVEVYSLMPLFRCRRMVLPAVSS